MNRSILVSGLVAAAILAPPPSLSQELMDKEILGYAYSNDRTLKFFITTREGKKTGICAPKSYLGYVVKVGQSSPLYFCYNMIGGDIHAVFEGGDISSPQRTIIKGDTFVINLMHQEKKRP